MNILILGGGGREHALVWAIKQNPKCDKVIAAPGNAGIAAIAECAAIDPCDATAVLGLCASENIDFVVIGPEAPLVAGVSDALRAAGILTFGPSRAAAELEASKAFTKEICAAAGAPTAAHAAFADRSAARAYLERAAIPVVVKADGLAAGKGVTVAETREAALAAVDDIFEGRFGAAGAAVVIEEFMTGEEASLFVLCDGTTALPVGTAQDHKRAFDGDTGPNTGGMGAYAPAPILSPEVEQRALDEIVRPTLDEMARRGMPYSGVLYVGLMIEAGAPRLVEYNVRFGDPECQALMVRLGAQALDLLLATAEGRLSGIRVQWADDHAMTVVMASEGSPGDYETGAPIAGIEAAEENPDVQVFHAGTALRDGRIVTAGGRVLNVTASGATLAEARAACYAAVDRIDWPGATVRRDIGWRALG